MHILHSLPAALIRRGNIDPVHKIMQHSGRQFLQVGIFLRPEDELLNAVGFFLLLGNLLLQKLHFLRQLCLLIFIIDRQLFKSAIIDFAGDIVLIEPFEQTVKLFHPALCLRELSALCGEFFLEILPTLCTQLIAEQILTIGDIPKQDLQKFQHALFQNNRTDEVRSAHVFSLLARGRADEMILSFFKVPRGAVVHFFSAIGTVGNAGKEVIHALRDQVAMVLQKNELFSGTIKENLRWGNENASDTEIVHACQLAQADSFIEAFPDRYDTYIEQGGTNVSGGQKQRLCIARALLKKPAILVLDDSTSAVDTKTDALIRKAFREEIPDTTKIIIAQRISSVQDADAILVLDDGRISGYGTHEQLLASNEIYHDIYISQTKGDNGHDEA